MIKLLKNVIQCNLSLWIPLMIGYILKSRHFQILYKIINIKKNNFTNRGHPLTAHNFPMVSIIEKFYCMSIKFVY